MIIGYLRSLIITVSMFIFGGLIGMLSFLLCAFFAKSLLEGINYIEHYGLVREKGKPVGMRHSWNSNHLLSSIYLCNVTRHSDHHRSTTLKFWELNPTHNDAPLLPYGYLSMLYLVLITPLLYKKIMAKELIEWDQNSATEYERNYTMQ
jgi:alkane 1-monooxygenase